MHLCISQSTTLSAPFADDITAFGEVEWRAAEVWLTKLEKHLESATVEDVRRLFAEKNVRRPLPHARGCCCRRGTAEAHFIPLAAGSGVPGPASDVLIATDYAPRADPQAWQQAVVSLKQAGQWAAGFGCGGL